MTTLRWLIGAVLVSTVVFLGADPSASSQVTSGVITGRVVAAGSTTGIDGATVQLNIVERAGGGGQAPVRTQETNARGEFTFPDLPPGLYELTAVKSPYLSAAFGQIRPGSGGPGVSIRITSGQRLDGVVVSMPLPASIVGRLVDEQGEPATGALARLLHYEWVAGQRVLRELSRVKIDDKGGYRMADLRAGEYLVAATPKAEKGAPVPPSLFYPGTPILASAQPVVIGAGEERMGVDIVVRPVVLASISGNLVGGDGEAPENVRLVVVDMNTGQSPAPGLAQFDMYSVTKEGAFTIANLGPGFYRVVAAARHNAADGTAVDLCAMTDVGVDDRDVADVRLEWRRCATLSGKVVVDSAKPRPAAVGTVALQPLDPGRQDLFAPMGRTDPDGQFTITGILPGRYTLSIARLPDGLSIRSIQVNGGDAQDAPIDIGPSEEIRGVEVSLSERRSLLTGRILDGMSRPTSACLVVVFPGDERAWLPGSARIRMVRPSNDGQYVLRDLPPGSYQVAAVPDVEPDEWFAQAFLRRIASGSATVTMGEGESKTVDVRMR